MQGLVGSGGDRAEVRVDGVRGAAGTEGGVVLAGAGALVPSLDEPFEVTLASMWDGKPHVAGQRATQRTINLATPPLS